MIDTKKHSRTTRDALIIEAIGEIGVLIERVSELEAKTVPLVHELEGKLVASISRVDNHAREKQAEFAVVADRERKVFEEKLNVSVAKTVNRMVNEVKRAEGLSLSMRCRVRSCTVFGIFTPPVWGSLT